MSAKLSSWAASAAISSIDSLRSVDPLSCAEARLEISGASASPPHVLSPCPDLHVYQFLRSWAGFMTKPRGGNERYLEAHIQVELIESR